MRVFPEYPDRWGGAALAAFGAIFIVGGATGPLMGVPTAPEPLRFKLLVLGVAVVTIGVLLIWLYCYLKDRHITQLSQESSSY